MIIKKDLYLVCEIPFIEPKFGVRAEEGKPEIITITTTREEAYKIATRYLEYKNFKQMYSQVYISYYNGKSGNYWGYLYLNSDLDNIVGILGADVVIDPMFTDNCPLYFHNPVSSSLNVLKSIGDFRVMCNWIKQEIENWFKRI